MVGLMIMFVWFIELMVTLAFRSSLLSQLSKTAKNGKRFERGIARNQPFCCASGSFRDCVGLFICTISTPSRIRKQPAIARPVSV